MRRKLLTEEDQNKILSNELTKVLFAKIEDLLSKLQEVIMAALRTDYWEHKGHSDYINANKEWERTILKCNRILSESTNIVIPLATIVEGKKIINELRHVLRENATPEQIEKINSYIELFKGKFKETIADILSKAQPKTSKQDMWKRIGKTLRNDDDWKDVMDKLQKHDQPAAPSTPTAPVAPPVSPVVEKPPEPSPAPVAPPASPVAEKPPEPSPAPVAPPATADKPPELSPVVTATKSQVINKPTKDKEKKLAKDGKKTVDKSGLNPVPPTGGEPATSTVDKPGVTDNSSKTKNFLYAPIAQEENALDSEQRKLLIKLGWLHTQCTPNDGPAHAPEVMKLKMKRRLKNVNPDMSNFDEENPAYKFAVPHIASSTAAREKYFRLGYDFMRKGGIGVQPPESSVPDAKAPGDTPSAPTSNIPPESSTTGSGSAEDPDFKLYTRLAKMSEEELKQFFASSLSEKEYQEIKDANPSRLSLVHALMEKTSPTKESFSLIQRMRRNLRNGVPPTISLNLENIASDRRLDYLKLMLRHRVS